MKLLICILISVLTLNSIASEIYEIPQGTIVLNYDRTDLYLEKISMQVSCFDKNGMWLACSDVKVNGKHVEESSIDFPASSQNEAKAPRITIDEGDADFFCVGMKAQFKGFPNVCDSVLYPSYPDRRSLDRYSILSFCSTLNIDEDSGAGARYASRRIVNWNDYLFLLKQPISLVLTDATPKECVAP